MMKKLTGLAVLSGVLSGGVMAMTDRAERADDQKVQAAIDARLHELLVKLNSKR